jgi:hypothetical protein
MRVRFGVQLNPMMSPKEQAIAEAALRAYPAANFDELFSQVAEYTGYPRNEVEEVISDLTADQTLTARIEPMLHPTPQIEDSVQIVQPWYDKGPMWDCPRVPVRW